MSVICQVFVPLALKLYALLFYGPAGRAGSRSFLQRHDVFITKEEDKKQNKIWNRKHKDGVMVVENQPETQHVHFTTQHTNYS